MIWIPKASNSFQWQAIESDLDTCRVGYLAFKKPSNHHQLLTKTTKNIKHPYETSTENQNIPLKPSKATNSPSNEVFFLFFSRPSLKACAQCWRRWFGPFMAAWRCFLWGAWGALIFCFGWFLVEFFFWGRYLVVF